MKKFLTITFILIASVVHAANTVVYDDATQTLTNKTIDCANNTCLNFPASNKYTTTFTSASLTSNQMVVTHSLGVKNFSGVEVFDDDGIPVMGYTLQAVNTGSAILDLTGMVVDNTWTLVVSE